MKTNDKIFTICNGAIMIALAIALSYIELEIGALGGSIGFAMIPIIVFSVKFGAVWGCFVGLVFGTLKFLLGGEAANFWSIMLDYSIAYAAVGFAGFFKSMKNRPVAATLGTAVGCFARFIVSFISGVTIYAEYAEPEYLGIATPNTFIYSIIYNGAYILPSMVIAIILVPVIVVALEKYKVWKN